MTARFTPDSSRSGRGRAAHRRPRRGPRLLGRGAADRADLALHLRELRRDGRGLSRRDRPADLHAAASTRRCGCSRRCWRSSKAPRTRSASPAAWRRSPPPSSPSSSPATASSPSRNVYPDAFRLFGTFLPRMGVEVDYVDGRDLAAVAARAARRPAPLSRKPDELADRGPSTSARSPRSPRARGILSVIDNSWATPDLPEPARRSASTSSSTRPRSISAATATSWPASSPARRELIDRLRGELYPYLGGKLVAVRRLAADPRPAHAADPHAGAPGVGARDRPAARRAPRWSTQVNHPGLGQPLPPGLRGTSGLFSFEFARRRRHARLLPTASSLFKLGVSWGGHESLVVPGEVVLEQKAQPNSAHAFGISPRSVRLHVGLEGTEALWSDIAAGARRPPGNDPSTTSINKGVKDMKRLLAATALAALFATSALADTTLKLVEVITSPERTETLKAIVGKFEAANPGTTVEIISLPWGEAFQKFATMVSAGETARRDGDARHLARRSTPTTACSRASSPISQNGSTPPTSTTGRSNSAATSSDTRLHAALRLLSAGDVLQQEAVRGGRRRRARRRRWTSSAPPPRRSRRCPANTATACAAARAASTAG